MSASFAERFRENASGIAATAVTGIWLAALVTDQGWWLAALLFGYVVVVPVVSMLFDEETDAREGEEGASRQREPEPEASADNRDALETLRERYARGELTDEQFERKLDRLLDTETLEQVEDRARERGEEREEGRERERE